MRIALIFNPYAGASLLSGAHLSPEEFQALLLATLCDLGIEAELYPTTLADPGEGIARQLACKRTDVVVVVGGDGTIHSVVRGLLGSSCVLGIIPAGTMNNLARSLGIPEDLQEACAILRSGEVRALDLGKINQHLFLEVAGVGLEAALYPAAEAVKGSGLFAILRGVVTGLWTLLRFQPAPMTVTFGGEKPRTYRAIQVTVCNSPYYGIHLNLAPGIIMNDGWLDAMIYTNFSKSAYLRHAFAIARGQRSLTPKGIFRRVKTLTIRASREMELHADGVVVGSTPAEISILPGAIRVLVPQKLGPGLLAATQDTRRRSRHKGKTYV